MLEIINVRKEYQSNNQKVEVLEDINLVIEKKDFITILGPSGCGKSTLIRCIGGFEQPSSGSILLEGKIINEPSLNSIMVFQSFEQLFPWKTVIQNVLYPLKVNNRQNSSENEEIAKHFISMVGLEKFMNHYPHQLSGGMKQRVAIARALALKPKILLLDEPFASLDAFTRNTLQQELVSIWMKTDVTIIFITHSIEEAILLGNRIIVMGKNPGKINEIIDNKMEYPRLLGDSGFPTIWEKVHSSLNFFK